MATSSRRSSGPVLPVTSAFQRSGVLGNSSMLTSDSSPFTSSSFASSTSYYSSSPAGFFNQRRSASPTRVNLHGLSQPPPTRSVRFAIDRSISPGRSISAAPRSQVVQRSGGNIQNRTCLCSPSTHPGSFRCALHRSSFGGGGGNQSISYSPNRLNEEICDDEFSGAYRYRRRRSGEASSSGFDSSVVAPAAPPSSVPAAAEPSFSHDQSRRYVMKQAQFAGLVNRRCSKYHSRDESVRSEAR